MHFNSKSRWNVSLIVFLLPSILSSSIDNSTECVHFPEKSCPSRDSNCLCKYIPPTESHDNEDNSTSATQNRKSESILCCHLKDVSQFEGGIDCASPKNNVNITALHIRNSALGNFTFPHALGNLSTLVSLAITDGVALTIAGRFADVTPNISCLNLSSNDMEDLQDDALDGLFSLRALNLSGNNVTGLPTLPKVIDGQSIWIDISGNEHLGCSGILHAMSHNVKSSASSHSPVVSSSTVVLSSTHPRVQINFKNKENTSCISPKGYDWFKWTQRTSLEDLEYRMKFREECPKSEGYVCKCALVRYTQFIGKEKPFLSVSVDCSGLGLKDLPVQLPIHTAVLNVSNNNISSLEPLGKNKHYNELTAFYADNNLISSIEVLEGSVFLENFQALSLNGNKLKELPTYFLKSIFQHTVYRNMRLGKNEYNCDCNTYHSLRAWVEENKKHILDHDEMVCASMEPKVVIIDLKKEEVCLHKTDWMDYLPIVVVAEILLLIALIAKVSYDYWIFKTKGYLPWPASRTPKIPCCDWAFDL